MEAQEYEKLVKALRCKRDDCDGCDLAFLDNDEGWMCQYAAKDDDAAAAIEELQSILTEADKKQAYQHDYICELVAEKEELQAETERLKAQLPKRGEWIRVQEVDIPGEMHPVAFKCMCSMCRNEYLFPKIPRYCPDCGSMNTAKTEVQE